MDSSPSESASRSSGPRRILVVDDSPTIRRVVGQVLTRAGYDVSNASDGLQALVVLKRESFHLALVDFVMPKLNGFELCRQLRDDPELRDLPVILMSVKADKIREHFVRQTGALDAITKPFDPRVLLLTIEAALQKAEGGTTRRVDSFPPDDGSGDSGYPPPSIRGVPEAFVRRLAETYLRVSPRLEGVHDILHASAVLENVLGADGLSGLHDELVGPSAGAVLSGDLRAIPLAEVLQLLQLQRQTGLLTIINDRVSRSQRAHGSTEVQIAMRDGLIDLATSRGAADEFRLGRYVIERGPLDRASLDDFISRERARSIPRLLGDALIAEGVLTRGDIISALERQTSELVYDVLRWTHGRFVFDQTATRTEATSAQLGLPVATIVMEGFRRVDEWRLMESALGDFAQVFYRDPGSIEAMGAGRLSREERNVLMAVDGERSIGDLVGALHMGSFDVCKILYQLVQSRLIRARVGQDSAGV